MRQGPRPSIVALALLLVAGAASPSRAAPAAPAPADVAPPAPADAAPRGLWLNFKLGTSLTSNFWGAPVPRFLIGYHLGRVAFGLEVSLSGGKTWPGPGTDPSYADYEDLSLALVPTVEVVVARRGRLVLAVQTGLGGGYGWTRSPAAQYRSTGAHAVLQASFGARYHLHPRFALGAELGASAIYARSVSTFEGTRTELGGVRANPWAALGATVIW